jgi:hypothetical protein
MTPLPKLQIIPPDFGACFIGMDVSRLTFDAILLDVQHKSYYIQVVNNAKGFKELDQWQGLRTGLDYKSRGAGFELCYFG